MTRLLPILCIPLLCIPHASPTGGHGFGLLQIHRTQQELPLILPSLVLPQGGEDGGGTPRRSRVPLLGGPRRADRPTGGTICRTRITRRSTSACPASLGRQEARACLIRTATLMPRYPAPDTEPDERTAATGTSAPGSQPIRGRVETAARRASSRLIMERTRVVVAAIRALLQCAGRPAPFALPRLDRGGIVARVRVSRT